MKTKFLQLVVALLTTLDIFQLKADYCQIPHANPIRFKYLSTRNASGHRLIQSSFQRPVTKFKTSSEESIDILEDKLTIDGKEVLITKFQITVDSCRKPQLDYEQFPGIGNYKLHLKAVTWNEARQICQSEGTNLIVINSQNEANIVKRMMRKNVEVSGETYPEISWCGFYKVTEEKSITVYGTPLEESGYTRWILNDFNGTDHDCGAMDKNALICLDPCSGKQRFICEQME